MCLINSLSFEEAVFLVRVQSNTVFPCSFLCVLTGNLDWVGNDFTFNAGAGLVVSQPEGVEDRNSTVVEQLKAAFERDWISPYTRSLQANKVPVCNKHQISVPVPVKSSALDKRADTAAHSNEPAPIRNSHKGNGQRAIQIKHQRNRQDITDGLVLSIDSHQNTGRVKMSRRANDQVQIEGDNSKNPVEAQSQSAESSGSRELASGAL